MYHSKRCESKAADSKSNLAAHGRTTGPTQDGWLFGHAQENTRVRCLGQRLCGHSRADGLGRASSGTRPGKRALLHRGLAERGAAERSVETSERIEKAVEHCTSVSSGFFRQVLPRCLSVISRNPGFPVNPRQVSAAACSLRSLPDTD